MRRRTPVVSLLCRCGPYRLWWLLWKLSPYHRGFEHGRESGINVGRCIERYEREHGRA